VHKHIFNKHPDVLESRFNKVRFEELFKENYMSDPNKLVNQVNTGGYGGGGYGGGYNRKGGDYRGGRQYERYDKDREDRKRKEYIDYDDPSIATKNNTNNPERQLVSYDDLF
jgi:hypothetical protein